MTFDLWMSYLLGLFTGSGGVILVITVFMARQRSRFLRHTDPLAGMVKVATGGQEHGRYRISKDL